MIKYNYDDDFLLLTVFLTSSFFSSVFSLFFSSSLLLMAVSVLGAGFNFSTSSNICRSASWWRSTSRLVNVTSIFCSVLLYVVENSGPSVLAWKRLKYTEHENQKPSEMLYVEQELLTLPEHLSSPLVLVGFSTWSLVLCVWQLCCLFFFDI